MNKKGFTMKNLLTFIIVVGLITYGVFYFIKKISKSADSLARESAEAIYRSANLYYINTMMLYENALEGKKDIYYCEFKDKGCKELDFVSTTKPTGGALNIYEGKVNAVLEYDKIRYYICNNEVTNNIQCLAEQTRNVTLENIKDYYNKNKSNFEGYECDFSKGDCDKSFSKFFNQQGKIIIDKNGDIEASLKIDDYDYYICNNKIEFDSNCLVNISLNKILNSLKEYYKEKSKDKKYSGSTLELPSEELNLKTVFEPTGEIQITKDGKINAKLNYNGVSRYICNSTISEKECE